MLRETAPKVSPSPSTKHRHPPLLREEYKQKKTRNFVSSPYPTLWLSDDDKVQPLPSNYGRFLSPCLVKLPPEQKMLTSSRVAFTPLVPHIRKNNILISVFDPTGTLSCRLMPTGCSHGHLLVAPQTMSSTSTSGHVANESPRIAQNPRNFASTPRPISYLSDDDNVQQLSSINGHILPPCLMKIPLRWRFLARSRVAPAPLFSHTGKNNMSIDFTYSLDTNARCLVAIGCSHGHVLGIQNDPIGLRDRP